MSMELGVPAGSRGDAPTRPVELPRLRPTAPDTAGWSGAATAAHSLLQISAPMMLRLDVSGHGRLVIDFSRREYVWDTPLDRFPADPERVVVGTRALDPDAPALFALRAHPLDPLLWLIGLAAFEDAPATWLRPDDGYRLVRWPNLTELDLTMAQVRLCAALGKDHHTIARLAEATGIAAGEVQRTINALSLIGVLHAVAPERRPEPAARPAGRIARLRARLGR